MDLLSATMACALFFTAPADCHKPQSEAASNSAAVAQWHGFMAEAAGRFSIPEDWIARVMAAESGGHLTLHGKPITSPKGAMGLMQLMPDTWQEMRQQWGLGSDPYDPHDNILAGAAYLRMLQDSFGAEGMFAAYNAGPGRYRDYLAGKRPLPAETEAYLARIKSEASSLLKNEPSRAVGADAHDLFVPLFKPSP